MKRPTRREMRRLLIPIVSQGGNRCYMECVDQLESALSRRPPTLQIDLMGVGEILPDFALLMRSVLLQRTSRTRIVTNARSSLQGGSVLVWLLGDTRIIREDASLFFRRADLPDPTLGFELATGDEPNIWVPSSELDPEEGDYARVLEHIDHFLPVNEFAGRLIPVAELRQFGLVESEKLDRFLASTMAKERTGCRRRSLRKGPKPTEQRAAKDPQATPEVILDFMI